MINYPGLDFYLIVLAARLRLRQTPRQVSLFMTYNFILLVMGVNKIYTKTN